MSVVSDAQFPRIPLIPYFRLPELADELQKLLKETDSQISKLPAAPSDDAQGQIIMLISDFARELAGYVEGTPDDNGIHQAIRPLNKVFLGGIRSTAPMFSPFIRGSTSCYTHPKFLLSDYEPDIYASDDNTICVDEVWDMGDR